mgnify:CR=1 FL=1
MAKLGGSFGRSGIAWAGSSCNPNGVSFGVGYALSPLKQGQLAKLSHDGLSITWSATEVEALAAQCPPTTCPLTFFNRNTFNNCPAFSLGPPYLEGKRSARLKVP